MSERVHQINPDLRLYGRGAGAPIYQRLEDYGSWVRLPDHAQGPRPAREELLALAARVAELEAENAKLRKCVEEADAMREEITCPNTGDKEPAENCCDACWSMIHYDAAREEVDK